MGTQHLWKRSTLVAALSTLTLVWAGSAAAADAAAPEAASIVVAREFMFAPTTLTVKVGSTVNWTNKDQEPHSVVSDSGLFRSGAIDTNESFSFRFEKPGTYRFFCSIHPQMVGTIVVQ